MAAAAAASLGLTPDAGWLAAAEAAGAGGSPGTLLAAFLAADLNAAGGGSLPDDVETFHDRTLTGRHVLQVDEVVNAGAPAKQRYANAGGAGRLLKLLLTDGRRHVVAFELEHVPCLRVDMEPGAKIAVTDALVLNGMLALRPANVAPLSSGGVARLARARGAALEAWGAPPSGAAAGDAPDAYARARAAAWSGSVVAVAAAQPAVAVAQPAAAAARPPPPTAPPPPPPPPPAAPKPDPGIVVLSDDDDDAMPPWPRAPLATAAAAAAGGTPTLALARVAAVTSPLRFMDGASQAPLPEFGLDIDLAPCGDGDDASAPRVAAALSSSLAARLLGDGATPASLVAAYAADGADAVLGRLAGLKRELAAFRGWVAVEGGRDGGRPVVTAWWPA